MANRPPVDVRCLRDGDVAAFRDLLFLFGEAFGDMETYTARQPSDSYLSDLLRDESVFVVTAFSLGRVIGGLVAYELKKFEQERSEIYIYDLAVAKSERRRGVATQLIEHLKAVSKLRSAYVVFVQADYGDDAAIALYDKLGVQERVLHYDIAVD